MSEEDARGKNRRRWLLAGLGLIALVAAHLYRTTSTELVLGWIPMELAYRLVWMVMAWVFLLFFTAQIWGDGEES